MTRFGEKIKDRREELKFSQEQLGKFCGVTRRTIVSYETGGKYPRPNTQRKLAKALGVTEYYLMHDDCDDPNAFIEEEPYVQEARDEYGKKGAEEMATLLAQNQALFAGGTISEEQKDMFFEAVSQAYFLNKQHAREKFGRKNGSTNANNTKAKTTKASDNPTTTK